MEINIAVLISCMAAVTFIPRAIPAVLIEKMKFSPRVEKFLKLIPYTAMAALIFPGILTVDPERPERGIVGGLIAAAAAYMRLPLMVSVIAAIAADYIIYLII